MHEIPPVCCHNRTGLHQRDMMSGGRCDRLPGVRSAHRKGYAPWPGACLRGYGTFGSRSPFARTGCVFEDPGCTRCLGGMKRWPPIWSPDSGVMLQARGACPREPAPGREGTWLGSFFIGYGQGHRSSSDVRSALIALARASRISYVVKASNGLYVQYHGILIFT